MRGLTIVLVEAGPERFRAALTLAAAQAALGGRARLFCQGEAVAVLAPPIVGPRDAAHHEAGQPTLAMLLDEALALGVEIILCQSGLQLAGLEASALDRRIASGGPIRLLQTLGEDRLLVV